MGLHGCKIPGTRCDGASERKHNVIPRRNDLFIVKHQVSKVNNVGVAIVTGQIKIIVDGVMRKIGNGIKPVFIVVQIQVKNAWVPVHVGRESDMRQRRPFFIGVGTHRHVRKATSNVEWDGATIHSGDGLSSTSRDGAIIDSLFEMLQLNGRMDGLALGHVCTLVHDEDDITTLRGNNSTSGHQRNVSKLVIVDALDIHGATTWL